MATKWTTRKIESSDQAFLWDMLYLALWDAPEEARKPRSVLNSPKISRLVENWGRPEDLGLIALDLDSKRQVGAIWTRLDGYDQIEGYGCQYPVLGIAVSEGCQGKGVGTVLLAHLIESARDRVPGLRLGVHPRNKTAIGLYEKFGFRDYAVGLGGYPQMKLEF